ncbi:MAG: large conductance mechanosensitive channel protein MscL [Flavobacteriaceae bacterium]|nr:large conductance mechanosensitive channel protein MscL [Flavobacteriaceae bacterium]
MVKMLREFKEFAMKGNLLDIAVGFVMGAAFNTLVKTFTDGIVSPLIGLLFKTDFKDLKWVLKKGGVDAEGVAVPDIVLEYGAFFTATLDFIIMAFVMFMIIKGVNSLRRQKVEEAAAAGPSQEELLTQIRDLLAKK